MNSCEENKSGVKSSDEMSCFCKQDFFQWGKISSTQVLPSNRDLDVSADFKTEQMFCKCDGNVGALHDSKVQMFHTLYSCSSTDYVNSLYLFLRKSRFPHYF